MSAAVKQIADHREDLTRKNCAYLREQLGMQTPFWDWWDKLPIAVQRTLCKAAKIQTCHEATTDEGTQKIARQLTWHRFSDSEKSRLETMAHKLKSHFEAIPQRKELSK